MRFRPGKAEVCSVHAAKTFRIHVSAKAASSARPVRPARNVFMREGALDAGSEGREG